MQILLLCPANVATGGTESIHRLCSTLKQFNPDTKLLYIGSNLIDPQPERYKNYVCDFITEYPRDFKGIVVFPEIWANQIVDPKYKDCLPIVNWQGVDVYAWNTSAENKGVYLRRNDAIHITNCDYGMDFLQKQGLSPIKVCDRLEDEFFEDFSVQYPRKDVVLYNPTAIKMTRFQQMVMARSTTELGIKFLALEGYSKADLIEVFRHHKLYIDFGLFSGRERLPREAVMCGCCLLTSKMGAAGYDGDNPINEYYKLDCGKDDVDYAIHQIQWVLKNYHTLYSSFDRYRESLIHDRDNYISDVERLYHEIFNYYSGV